MNVRTDTKPPRVVAWHNTNVQWGSGRVYELIFVVQAGRDQVIHVPIRAAYNMRSCATDKLTL
jgi:hypothetical protein